MRVYLDADVLIWHLRGEPRALSFFQSLGHEKTESLWVGAMQRAEVLFFTRPHEEAGTRLLLSHCKTAPVTESIIDEAAGLYRKWNPSHGVDVHDAILAATVMTTGGVLYTLNRKHYPMPGLSVIKAWG